MQASIKLYRSISDAKQTEGANPLSQIDDKPQINII
ncbi:hypothetical protein SCTVLC_1004 [Serratia symbiotica SCt-VLC]|uniref:Uncharacterized protein n=1 Tax=Serratia symbiotica SCt-VLC TaxID=1347341 RepID=A0A068RD58_9GAMM|nr:hypothetical protein SCTVLC_1004 [Serratia symbiotica SCt-VLC]